MRELCTFADYFVICSGDTHRQIKAVYEELDRALRKEGITLPTCPGSQMLANASWGIKARD